MIDRMERAEQIQKHAESWHVGRNGVISLLSASRCTPDTMGRA